MFSLDDFACVQMLQVAFTSALAVSRRRAALGFHSARTRGWKTLTKVESSKCLASFMAEEAGRDVDKSKSTLCLLTFQVKWVPTHVQTALTVSSRTRTCICCLWLCTVFFICDACSRKKLYVSNLVKSN